MEGPERLPIIILFVSEVSVRRWREIIVQWYVCVYCHGYGFGMLMCEVEAGGVTCAGNATMLRYVLLYVLG